MSGKAFRGPATHGQRPRAGAPTAIGRAPTPSLGVRTSCPPSPAVLPDAPVGVNCRRPPTQTRAGETPAPPEMPAVTTPLPGVALDSVAPRGAGETPAPPEMRAAATASCGVACDSVSIRGAGETPAPPEMRAVTTPLPGVTRGAVSVRGAGETPAPPEMPAAAVSGSPYVLYRAHGVARYPFLAAWVQRHRLSAGFQTDHARHFGHVIVIGPPDGLLLPASCRVTYVQAEVAERLFAADPSPEHFFQAAPDGSDPADGSDPTDPTDSHNPTTPTKEHQ